MKKLTIKKILSLLTILVFVCSTCLASASNAKEPVIVTSKIGLLKAILAKEDQIVVEGPLADEVAKKYKDKQKIQQEAKEKDFKLPEEGCDPVTVLGGLALVSSTVVFIVWLGLHYGMDQIEIEVEGRDVNGNTVATRIKLRKSTPQAQALNDIQSHYVVCC